MKKETLSYIKKHQSSMRPMDATSMFLSELEVNKMVYIVSNQVEDQQLQFVINQLENQKYVGLYTNIKMKKKVKETLRKISVVEMSEKEYEDTRFIRTIYKVMWVLLALALIWLATSMFLSFYGYPIGIENDVTRVFAPLVVLTLISVFIDLIRSYRVKNQSVNTFLQLNLFRTRRYRLNAWFVLVDQQKLYINLLQAYEGKSIGWYEILDSDAIEEYRSLIHNQTPLSRKMGLSENETLAWLFDE